MSMKGGLCKAGSQASRLAGPMEAPWQLLPPKAPGAAKAQGLSAGFDRLRWPATAVETEHSVQTQPVMSFVSDERASTAPCQPLPQQQRVERQELSADSLCT